MERDGLAVLSERSGGAAHRCLQLGLNKRAGCTFAAMPFACCSILMGLHNSAL
jgi:hypothetical protein